MLRTDVLAKIGHSGLQDLNLASLSIEALTAEDKAYAQIHHYLKIHEKDLKPEDSRVFFKQAIVYTGSNNWLTLSPELQRDLNLGVSTNMLQKDVDELRKLLSEQVGKINPGWHVKFVLRKKNPFTSTSVNNK